MNDPALAKYVSRRRLSYCYERFFFCFRVTGTGEYLTQGVRTIFFSAMQCKQRTSTSHYKYCRSLASNRYSSLPKRLRDSNSKDIFKKLKCSTCELIERVALKLKSVFGGGRRENHHTQIRCLCVPVVLPTKFYPHHESCDFPINNWYR